MPRVNACEYINYHLMPLFFPSLVSKLYPYFSVKFKIDDTINISFNSLKQESLLWT